MLSASLYKEEFIRTLLIFRAKSRMLAISCPKISKSVGNLNFSNSKFKGSKKNGSFSLDKVRILIKLRAETLVGNFHPKKSTRGLVWNLHICERALKKKNLVGKKKVHEGRNRTLGYTALFISMWGGGGGVFWDKTKTRGARVKGNQKFSDCRERTCGQMDRGNGQDGPK